MMLVLGKDNTQPISYHTHNHACHSGMNAANVDGKTASTHLDRNTVGCELIEKGVGVNDTGLYLGWYRSTGADYYMRGAFKTEPMLIAHGWEGRKGFECWWENGDQELPTLLEDAIFPGLNALYEKSLQCNDRSAIEFLKSLQLLRRIFLEDAVEKQ